MDDKRKIIALRVASVFIEKYGYQLSFIEKDNNEMVVTNLERDRYPLIRITTQDTEPSIETRRVVDVFNTTYFKLARKEKINDILTLVIGDEKSGSFNHRYYLNADHKVPTDLESEFSQLNTVNYDVQDEFNEHIDVVRKINEANKPRKRKRFEFSNLKGTMFFIITCVLVFLLSLYIQSISQYEATYLITLGGIYVPFIQGAHEFWRLITAGFVHVGISHLLFNLIAMLTLGQILEKAYGTKQFVTTVLFSIITGGLFVYIGEFNSAVTVGLSSGLYGLMALMVVYYFETGLIKVPGFRNQLFYVLMINLVVNFMPSVSWLGHLGGFVGGLFCGFIFSKKPEWKLLRTNGIIGGLALVLMLGYLSFNRLKPNADDLYILSDQDNFQVLRKLNLKGYADQLEEKMVKFYYERLEK